MRPPIPTHRVDKAPEYVPITDLAWDRERIVVELEDTEDDGWRDHPFFRYHRGETRYDLDAAEEWNGEPTTARSYLRAERPEVWRLRRLELQEWYEVMGLMRSSGIELAALRACRLGVVGVDEYQGTPLKGFEKGDRLAAADIHTLGRAEPGSIDGIDVCGVRWPLDPLPVTLGRAVIDASVGPTEAERKQSGS